MLNYRSVSVASILVIVVLIASNYAYNTSLLYVALVFLIWFIITGLGSAFIGLKYHLPSVLANHATEKNEVAITFDDGPNTTFTPKVLALLEQYNAKATFFCIGKNIEAQPDIVKTIVAKGHTVGNHTFSHSNFFGFFPTKKVKEELAITNKLIQGVIGVPPKLYRPAFGVTNPKIRRAVKALGLTSVGWSVRSLDTTSRSSIEVVRRVTKNLKRGDIILLHDTSDKTLIVLEQLLLFLQHQKLASVTVDALCDIKAYV